jgi:tRNA threonylcarbamoyladenosine biosynthesis protein TsaB
MKLLLAVDTSGKNGSLALAHIEPDNSAISVLEVVPLAGGAFSAELIPQIADLLQKHKQTKRDLEAFAVASGPGSFTGLRVGLAAIKGLAEALQKPIAAVSLLEAVASDGSSHGRILAVLDAGRTDVYVGDYKLGPPALMGSERLLSRENLLVEARIASVNGTAVVTTDPGLADAIRTAGIEVKQIEYPNAGAIAHIGWNHIQRGQIVRPEELEANYLRHSDAEIFAKPPR